MQEKVGGKTKLATHFKSKGVVFLSWWYPKIPFGDELDVFIVVAITLSSCFPRSSVSFSLVNRQFKLEGLNKGN